MGYGSCVFLEEKVLYYFNYYFRPKTPSTMEPNEKE